MIVSFETALKLKEAGFPQANPSAGQVRYYDGSPLIIISTYAIELFSGQCFQVYVCHPGGDEIFSLTTEENNLWVFAPTATDILRELDWTFTLAPPMNNEMWATVCGVDVFEHENPAESCALAWLAGYREPIKMPVHTITCMTDSSLSVGNVESK
jgi:hypothetical protein